MPKGCKITIFLCCCRRSPAPPRPRLAPSRSARTVTLLVRGSNKMVVDEADRSIHDALCVISLSCQEEVSLLLLCVCVVFCIYDFYSLIKIANLSLKKKKSKMSFFGAHLPASRCCVLLCSSNSPLIILTSSPILPTIL